MKRIIAFLAVLALSACLDEPQMKTDAATDCKQQNIFVKSVLAEAEKEAMKIAQSLGMDTDKVDYQSLVSISYNVTGKQGYSINVDGNYVYIKIDLVKEGCLRNKGGGNELMEK